MFGDLNKYLAVFLTGFVVTYLLTPLVRRLAFRFGVVDQPNERRPHKIPTARGGGLAVVLGVHAAALLALALPWPGVTGNFDLHWWRHFTVASVVLVLVGVIDDVRGMKPVVKLGGQILAALLISSSGIQFGNVLGHAIPPWLDTVMVVIYLVAIINAFNLIDGLDGLASGLAIISALGLVGIFLFGKLPGNVLLLLGLIGACLAFLRYNFHPATVFLGDTGSMFLGFTLGVVSLQTMTKSTFLMSLTIPLLVLGVPIYDALLAIWRRSARLWLNHGRTDASGKRGGIMQPDLDHLHHRLLKAGFSTRRVATVLCLGNAALVVFGLLITIFRSHSQGIFIIALLAGAYVLMRHLAVIELRETGKALLTGLRRPTHDTLKSLGYPVWDVLVLGGALALAMWSFGAPMINFWHSWFLDLPVWVTPTFSLLILSRTYVIVWNRARLLDVLMLVFTIQCGLVLSFGIALLIDPASARLDALTALILAGVAHPAIIGLRVVYRSVEELLFYLRNKSETEPGSERVLLYGAGGRCQLFLKERGFNNSRSFQGRAILGLIDDDPTLHFKWVYGHPVLGGGADLPRIIERLRIDSIIATTQLNPEALEALRKTATERGLHLSEWNFDLRKLELAPSPPK